MDAKKLIEEVLLPVYNLGFQMQGVKGMDVLSKDFPSVEASAEHRSGVVETLAGLIMDFRQGQAATMQMMELPFPLGQDQEAMTGAVVAAYKQGKGSEFPFPIVARLEEAVGELGQTLMFLQGGAWIDVDERANRHGGILKDNAVTAVNMLFEHVGHPQRLKDTPQGAQFVNV